MTDIGKLSGAAWKALSEGEKGKWLTKSKSETESYEKVHGKATKAPKAGAKAKPAKGDKTVRGLPRGGRGAAPLIPPPFFCARAVGNLAPLNTPPPLTPPAPRPPPPRARPLPQGPKKPITPYFAYINEVRPAFKAKNPGTPVTELAKLMGAAWKEMGAAEKKKYEDIAAKDKKRYDAEMA